MQNVVNFLRGNTRLEVQCVYPERFMNLCAENGIGFWSLVRIDAVTLQITMTNRNARRLHGLLADSDTTVRLMRRAGVPVFLRQIRKRYALLAGLLLALAGLWVMSLYIWEIEVVGNETVPLVEILQALEEVGVEVGTFGGHVDGELIRNQVLLQMPELAWITVNVNGSRATVIVRERVLQPFMIAERVPTAVYATQSGVIERMMVWEGIPLFEIGDTVTIGQDIVSGQMESLVSGTRFVRADAEIFARTWYDLSMTMPLELAEKAYTGRVSSKRTIFFGQNRINLFFDSGISYARYDKIREESRWELPGGIVLPIRTERRMYREYVPMYSLLCHEQAAEILKERLLATLRELIGAQGEILQTEFTVEVDNGVITVHLHAECREQIAAQRRLEEHEMIPAPEITEETEETAT